MEKGGADFWWRPAETNTLQAGSHKFTRPCLFYLGRLHFLTIRSAELEPKAITWPPISQSRPEAYDDEAGLRSELISLVLRVKSLFQRPVSLRFPSLDSIYYHSFDRTLGREQISGKKTARVCFRMPFHRIDGSVTRDSDAWSRTTVLLESEKSWSLN